MITIKLFLIQLFATIAVLLINSILVFAYFNYIIVDLLPSYMNLNVPIHAIFVTLFGIHTFINNMRVPYSTYQLEEGDSIDDAISEELGDLTMHILQSSLCVFGLVIVMVLFA